MVPDGMIKDDWTDSPDKDSDEDEANPHSTQVGQGYLHWNGQVIQGHLHYTADNKQYFIHVRCKSNSSLI